MTREWSYWTLNKLAILEDYLPAFNKASAKSPTRVYIDLMAGESENIERGTGTSFDGSPRIAVGAEPGFTHLAFIEINPAKARSLREDLASSFPGDSRYQVYEGDCNLTIDQVLTNLDSYRWSPTFAFVDQQAAEINWSTLAKLAAFRKGSRKSELWVLMSPAMIIKGITGTNGDAYAKRVDRLYGDTAWRDIWKAWESKNLDPEGFRSEMVNLFRWRLEHDLGYQVTARIPMRMQNNVPLYDMVFATDHFVGDKIMTSLYKAAAEREPRMRDELRTRKLNQDEASTLFPVTVDMLTETESIQWEKTACWDPRETSWWR